MVDLVVTCGDSFACGSGLEFEDCFEKSFGGLAADYLDVPQHVLARSGCCNFAIWLQIKHAVKQWGGSLKTPLVIISVTHYARTVWFKPGQMPSHGNQATLENLNYEDYSPYNHVPDEKYRRPIPVATNHSMQSETLSNLDTFFDKRVKASWPQFNNHEPAPRLRVLRDWVADFFSPGIKQEYDNGVLLQGHLLLKKHNIPHIFMTTQLDLLNLLPEENVAKVDWGHWSNLYPDKHGSGHCDYQGHVEAFNIIKHSIDLQVK